MRIRGWSSDVCSSDLRNRMGKRDIAARERPKVHSPAKLDDVQLYPVGDALFLQLGPGERGGEGRGVTRHIAQILHQIGNRADVNFMAMCQHNAQQDVSPFLYEGGTGQTTVKRR